MDLIRHGWASDCGDDRFMKVAIEEKEAQLETLRALEAAIKQHRRILAGKQDYIAKIEMTIQCRRCCVPFTSAFSISKASKAG